MPHTSPLVAGLTLENRYRIVRELGRGGFGRTYLAEDINRSREYCVLKEFAPEVQGTNELQKAKELFEREAGVLYNLQHPQIPRFRELLRVNISGTESLFLVQDYVEGQTYFALLQSYQQQGQRFNETQVTQLLLDILPVLEYIHSQGVVHRDISPDNIIQRSSDKLPVLIDFGAVKQVAANAVSLYSRLHANPTRIGKQGYAPDEQMIRGQALPCSDLYTLAVTALVLLTGKDPQQLYDANNATWNWRQEVNVSRAFGAVLERMLAHRTSDRYQSAREVIPALQAANPNISQMQTINFVGSSPAPTPQALPNNQPQSSNNNRTLVIPSSVTNLISSPPKLLAIGIGIALLSWFGGWALIRSGFSPFQPGILSPFKSPDTSLSKSEQARRNKIVQRLQDLKIQQAAFYNKVDQLFHAQHPELQRRSLSDKPEDANLRQQWYQIAENLLDELEQGAQL
jgi:serine/threonine-protein kinase